MADEPYDVIVVGSGPAGTFAAWRLTGLRVLVLDVGIEAPDALPPDASVAELRRTGQADVDTLLGPRWESLHNISRPFLSPKLKAAAMRFVTDGHERWTPLVGTGFEGRLSLARGGLANAWGAGVYRFTDEELAGFPFGPTTLAPYYDLATEHLGISGADDDLRPYFGSTAGLLPAPELGPIGRTLLRRYARRRAHFRRHHLTLGHPRIAVLTRDHQGRAAYRYTGAEFFRPRLSGIYNPAFTLESMIDAGVITYRSGALVERYREDDDGVTVIAREVDTGVRRAHRARALVLAAGALNSARIVLRAHDDHETRLPVLDNLVSFVPLLDPWRIGMRPPERSLPLQANLVYDGPLTDERIQGSCYGMSATLASDFAFELPLWARANVRLIRDVLPAITTLQLFYPDRPRAGNDLRLTRDGALRIRYDPAPRGVLERHLVRVFARAGYWSLSRLSKTLPAGHSFHYAGPLPMRATPRARYETDGDGRLAGSRAVYVADAATFPRLPSKNLTFTIMANAMRIADQVRARVAA